MAIKFGSAQWLPGRGSFFITIIRAVLAGVDLVKGRPAFQVPRLPAFVFLEEVLTFRANRGFCRAVPVEGSQQWLLSLSSFCRGSTTKPDRNLSTNLTGKVKVLLAPGMVVFQS